MKMLISFLFLSVFVAPALSGIGDRLQKYSVKGRLVCGTAGAGGVKVKLVDTDVASEDVLDEKTTDGQGNFFLSGQTSEVTDIDPVLKIYHNCLDNVLTIRHRRWRFEMPKKHINKGTVDVGVLNLEVKPLEEDRNL